MPHEFDAERMSPRRLTQDDVASGYRLSSQAGWNQTEHDWQLMIDVGQGVGFIDRDEKLIATAILVPYRSTIDWVSMILVDEEWRGRGIGKRLTQLIVELSPRPVLGLDATHMGARIYRQLGFGQSEEIIRFYRPEQPPDSPSIESKQIIQVTKDEFRDGLNQFIRDSEPVRADLLCALDREENGRLRMVRGEKTAAVGLIRDGRLATHIGPLLATDAGSATMLLRWLASERTEPLSIDIFERHGALTSQVVDLGFSVQRSFVRMFRGGLPPPNPYEYAVTGPEFG